MLRSKDFSLLTLRLSFHCISSIFSSSHFHRNFQSSHDSPWSLVLFFEQPNVFCEIDQSHLFQNSLFVSKISGCELNFNCISLATFFRLAFELFLHQFSRKHHFFPFFFSQLDSVHFQVWTNPQSLFLVHIFCVIYSSTFFLPIPTFNISFPTSNFQNV